MALVKRVIAEAGATVSSERVYRIAVDWQGVGRLRTYFQVIFNLLTGVGGRRYPPIWPGLLFTNP